MSSIKRYKSYDMYKSHTSCMMKKQVTVEEKSEQMKETFAKMIRPEVRAAMTDFEYQRWEKMMFETEPMMEVLDRIFKNLDDKEIEGTKDDQQNGVERYKKCDQCFKCFATKATLKRHTRVVHDQQYPYKCEICLKKFSQRWYQNKHTQKCSQKFDKIL